MGRARASFGFAKPLVALGLVCLWAGPAVPAEAVQHSPASNRLVVCPSENLKSDCDYASLRAAIEAAGDGATILVRPGEYREAAVGRADNVTIRGEPGAHVRGVAAENKAALVIRGHNVLIEELECSDIWSKHGNGACVRAEGVNLTLRRVYFHDSQEGILGGKGRILIEDSIFERLGGDEKIALGQAHAIYVGHHVDDFMLRRSRILSSKEEGHEVKSRARRTVIENNVIASLDGRDSRLIDIPNGGEIVIRNNLLEKGPNSSNPDVVGVGLERGHNPALDHAVNSILIEGNTIILDLPGETRIVRVQGVPPPVMSNNTVIGGRPEANGGDRWFRDRGSAGLPPYPELKRRQGE